MVARQAPPGPKPNVRRVGPFERLARTRGSGPLQRIRQVSLLGVPLVAALFGLYVLGTTVYRATIHREMVADGVCTTWPWRMPMRCRAGTM